MRTYLKSFMIRREGVERRSEEEERMGQKDR